MKFVGSWKTFSYQLKECLCTFVETDLLKAGLNHVMFHFRVFGFSVLLLVYFPDFFNALKIVVKSALKISWLEEFFHGLSMMEFGNFLMICGGCFDDALDGSKCNCRKKEECQMEVNPQVNAAVYKCDVTRPLPKKVYLGLAEGEWKSRFYNQKLSFKHKRYSNKATLSSYTCHLESVSSETLNLKWPVLRCIPPYSNISKKCLLCLYEKLEIFTYQNQKKLMNKKSELHCNCHHANKFLLKNCNGNDFR